MKYGIIYDCKNQEEAKAFIGKRGVFSDFLSRLVDEPEKGTDSILLEVGGCSEMPFKTNGLRYQFFRPILEQKHDLMTNRQLSRWLSEGHGEWKWEKDEVIHCGSFFYDPGYEDEELPFDVRIRRYDSDEWVYPTRNIYEGDCE